jgi:maleate isomerase
MPFESWRGQAGMIAPVLRPGPAEEVVRLLPEGLSLMTLYLDVERGSLDEFRRAVSLYEAPCERLVKAGCEVLHPGGAPPFMLLGRIDEKALVESWERRWGCEVFTSGMNHVAAFAALGAGQIVGATYSSVQNEIVRRYLVAAGLDVLAIEPIETPFDRAGQIPPHALYAHIGRLMRSHPGAEAIYVQGSGWRTLKVIELLEADFGVPVVHAVAAKAWEFQMRLKVRAPIRGYGRLLRDLPKPP